MASAKASAKIMAVWIFGAASGSRRMASAEREPIMPMAIAGPMAPIMIVPIAAHRRTVSKSILFSVDFSWTTFLFFFRKCRALNRGAALLYQGFSISTRNCFLPRRDRRFSESLGMSFLAVACGRDGDENDGEHGEDQRLHETDEDLQEQEGQRHDVGDQECHDGQKHFAREDVPEETEGEGDHFGDLRHYLDEADEEIDGSAEIEELAQMLPESDGCDAEQVLSDDRDHREAQGEIEVRGRRPEERRPLVPLEHQGTHARQEAEPIGEKDEQEDGRDERQVLFRPAPVAEDRVHETQERFQENFEKRLELARYHPQAVPGGEGEPAQKHEHDHREQGGVGDRPAADPEKLLRLERDMDAGAAFVRDLFGQVLGGGMFDWFRHLKNERILSEKRRISKEISFLAHFHLSTGCCYFLL